MALSARKKVALGFGLTGLVFIAVAAIVWNTTVNPTWLTIALPAVAFVADALGLAIVLPQLP
jgi:hypothetical protein